MNNHNKRMGLIEIPTGPLSRSLVFWDSEWNDFENEVARCTITYGKRWGFSRLGEMQCCTASYG